MRLSSSWPLADVRVPGFDAAAQIQRRDAGHWSVTLERTQAALDRDFVVYYRLADDLPGRVELLPYRSAPDQPGTFMLVLTPGIDIKPLDYVFVLDVSGSMQGAKLRTQAQAVGKALAQLGRDDRFRIVTFATAAAERAHGWTPATPEAVETATRAVEALVANGSMNLFAGLGLALRSLDADRATAVLLLTDGVTNTGVVDPPAFERLLKQHDVRVFGFLIGNSANWPLMRLVTEASGGFYAALSNADDVIGQVLLAKAKLRAEALHDAKFTVSGVKVFGTTDGAVGKVYRGQQLVVFGRYERGGRATLTLKAALTGKDKTYTTTVTFPDVGSTRRSRCSPAQCHRSRARAPRRGRGGPGDGGAWRLGWRASPCGAGMPAAAGPGHEHCRRKAPEGRPRPRRPRRRRLRRPRRDRLPRVRPRRDRRRRGVAARDGSLDPLRAGPPAVGRPRARGVA